jgi:G3E family GTPase
MDAVPVTLLTGFLGSGKTTLLGQVLRDPRFSDTAVVINEFGDVGLDHALVERSGDELIEMTSGCLCCTIRGDIRRTLVDLHARSSAGSVPMFSRLIVETTGLADPAPVLHTLMADAAVWQRYRLGGVVTTVDAVNAEATLARQAECVKQVAVADRLVLTKTDLVADPASRKDLLELRRRLARLNPGAAVLDRQADGFDLRRLFDTACFDPRSKTIDVQRWLNEEAYRAGHAHDHAGSHDAHAHGHDHRHGHAHGHGRHEVHDVNRHGSDIEAYCLVRDQPISGLALSLVLELLVANRGEDLLRVKGIVNVAGKPDRPCVIHGVQHVFHDPVWLDAWPDADRRTRIVFITRNLPRTAIEPIFAAFDGLSDGAAGLEASLGEGPR